MKKIVIALAALAFIGVNAAGAAEYVNVTKVEPTMNEQGKKVVQLPDKKKTSRRRMLVDFGLFGAGIHIGWLKPKQYEIEKVADTDKTANGGDSDTKAVRIKKHRGFGGPIFNVSAGNHALGLGTK